MTLFPIRLSSMPGRVVSFAVAGACAAVLTGCAAVADGKAGGNKIVEVHDAHPSSLNGTEIGDVIPRPRLRLRDTSGELFDLRSRPRGELTLLFFGYTQCRDVCPATMADLAATSRALPVDQRARVRTVFVTEDPRHDTAPVLRAWLDRFSPAFVGLIGGNATTATALTALKAPATEVVPREKSSAAPLATPDGDHHGEGAETVEHTGSVYAFFGDRVVVYTGGTTPREYAADFDELLSS